MIVAFNKNTSIRRGITLNVKGVISYIIICHESVKLNDHFAYTILQKGKLQSSFYRRNEKSSTAAATVQSS